jgi:hypothetical protein
MSCREHDDLGRTIEKERIDTNGKGIDALLPEGRECRIDLCDGTGVEDYDLPPDIGGRGPNIVQLSIDIRRIRIDENADGRCVGSQLTQEPEPLRLQLGLKPAVAGEVAAGSLQVGNQAAAEWIRCDGKEVWRSHCRAAIFSDECPLCAKSGHKPGWPRHHIRAGTSLFRMRRP